MLVFCGAIASSGQGARPEHSTGPVQGDRFEESIARSAAKSESPKSNTAQSPSFEENAGQVDARVKYLARGADYTLYLTAEGVVFNVISSGGENASRSPWLPNREREDALQTSLSMNFVNAAGNGRALVGSEMLARKSNYFIGNDPQRWHTNVSNFAKVKYNQLYPGIDLIFYGKKQAELEFDFLVAPGADYKQIKLSFDGAEKVFLDDHGTLVLDMGRTRLEQRRPLVYQLIEGQRQYIEGSFVLVGDREVAFNVGDYDRGKELIIDPVVFYATYLGGTFHDKAYEIAVDGTGCAYVAGFTTSADFPTKSTIPGGAVLRGTSDVFVSKLSPEGNEIVASTYIGGSESDTGWAIAIDSAGGVYVTGETRSSDFPLVNAFQTILKGGWNPDAFVMKLSSNLNSIIYSTYLGGMKQDSGADIAVSSDGYAFITGTAWSSDLPVKNAFQSTLKGLHDAYVAKISKNGGSLEYLTYYGGDYSEDGTAIAIDTDGNAYITGGTDSPNLPMVNSFQSSTGGSYDIFVAKFSATGKNLLYSSYLGGSASDYALDVTVMAGSAYVVGGTFSGNFPLANPLQASRGNINGFISKFSPQGKQLEFSTFVGSGKEESYVAGISVSTSRHMYIVGATSDVEDFPTKNNFQQAPSADWAAFVAKVSPAGNMFVYSSLFGGTTTEYLSDGPQAIVVDSAENAYIVGHTRTNKFPTKNPFQLESHNNDSLYDGYNFESFVLKVGEIRVLLR